MLCVDDMSLSRKYQRASSLLETLERNEVAALSHICRTIEQAQCELLASAAPFMNDCAQRCRGLCCRNIRPDDVIDLFDLQCLLIRLPGLKSEIERRAAACSLFSGPCVFLKDGKGPCILPGDLKPRVCVTTFCQDDTALKVQIHAVEAAFGQLYRFWRYRRIPAWLRRWIPPIRSQRSAPHWQLFR